MKRFIWASFWVALWASGIFLPVEVGPGQDFWALKQASLFSFDHAAYRQGDWGRVFGQALPFLIGLLITDWRLRKANKS